LRDPKENIDIAARLIGIYLKTLKNAMGSVNDGTWGGIPIEVVERALLSANVPSLANAFRSEVSNVIGNPDAIISQTLTAAITAMTNNSVSALNPNLLTLDTEKHVANAIGLTQIINAERYRD
jgi:hypothetical protein